jgi:hypothetical protein
MKLKNKMKDVRQLRVLGQIVKVKPGETIEVESANYDEQVFEVIETQKSKDKPEQPTKKGEVK